MLPQRHSRHAAEHKQGEGGTCERGVHNILHVAQPRQEGSRASQQEGDHHSWPACTQQCSTRRCMHELRAQINPHTASAPCVLSGCNACDHEDASADGAAHGGQQQVPQAQAAAEGHRIVCAGLQGAGTSPGLEGCHRAAQAWQGAHVKPRLGLSVSQPPSPSPVGQAAAALSVSEQAYCCVAVHGVCTAVSWALMSVISSQPRCQ